MLMISNLYAPAKETKRNDLVANEDKEKYLM